MKEKKTNSHWKINTLDISFLHHNLTTFVAKHADIILRNELTVPQLLNNVIKVACHQRTTQKKKTTTTTKKCLNV